MKTLTLAIISTAIVLASCSTMRPAAYSEYDDVYYNPSNVQNQAAQAVAPATTVVTPQDAMNAQPIYQEPVAQGDEQLSDYEKYKMQQEAEMLGESYTPEGSEALYSTQYQEIDTAGVYGQEKAAVIVNNYYNDPTDYYYASNLRRFSDTYYGWNYYDPYYTDLYWYTGSPFSWGITMGWGYPGWGMRFSYGYPYYSPYYGYGGWYDPWYSWGGYYGGYWGGYYPYWGYGGSYWNGYYNGFYSGLYYGSGNDYYNNYRYGRLSSRHSLGYSSRSNVITGNSKTSLAGDPRYRSRTTSATRTETATRSNANVTSSAQRQARTTTNTAAQRQVRTNTNGAVKTTRTTPATVQQRSNSAVRSGTTYTPSYSKPRTSPTSTYNRSVTPSRSTVPSRTYTQPGTQSRTVSPAVRTPSRSSATFSRPSSSSRSSSSFSRPSSSSRSSSSFSRPSSSSRSSGSVSRSMGSSSRSSGSVSRSSGSSVSRSSGGSSRSSSSRR
jgi:hypothetical protein